MNKSTIPEIINSLRDQKRLLEADRESVRQQLESIDHSIRRVDSAVAALEGAPTNTSGKRKANKDRAAKDNTKPMPLVAGKVEVTGYLEMILREERPVDERALKERVEELAVQDGYSRLGLALRVKQALADGRFARTPGGITLGDAANQRSQAE